ncbi:MAG TPA: hypothetical protein VGX03_26295 [Candidatus Binatia bacterium]|jgi:hypothetical protein|nr:hypothetical protein [Candidatus Binatia bacterium]
MKSYSFTLQVVGIDTSRDRYEDALFEAGCDDALLAVVDGALILSFDREAPSFDAAVASATECVEKAGGRVIGFQQIHHSD